MRCRSEGLHITYSLTCQDLDLQKNPFRSFHGLKKPKKVSQFSLRLGLSETTFRPLTTKDHRPRHKSLP